MTRDPIGPTEAAATALPAIPGGWTDRIVRVAGGQFDLTVPAEPDAFLDDAATLAAHGVRPGDGDSGDLPVWPHLWPCSIEAAGLMFTTDWPAILGRQPCGTRAMELGSGLGLLGLAARRRGFSVTLTDYQQPSLDCAIHNARRNGLDHVRAARLDWTRSRGGPAGRFRLVFGSDLLYEPRVHAALVGTIRRFLEPDGLCWIADPGRRQADGFLEVARSAGFAVRRHDGHGRIFDHTEVGRFQVCELRPRSIRIGTTKCTKDTKKC